MRFLILAFLWLAPCLAWAQTPPSPSLSVDAVVEIALQNNPQLSAAARDVLAAQLGVRSARALVNPEIIFTPAITAGGTDQELLVRQPLELNGTRAARTGVAEAQSRGARAEALVELRDLVFATKSAYYELARAREQLALAKTTLRIAEDFDRITRQMVQTGARPGVEQMQTGIEVARARQQVTLATSQATSALAALNTQMGRDPASPVETLPPPIATFPPVDTAAALRQALSARAEITVAEEEAQAQRQTARLARAEGRPDLAPQYRATSLTRGAQDQGIGVGLTLPFLDYGSRRNRIRQAEEAARADEDRVSAIRNQIRQEVEQAIAHLLATETVIQDYQQGILDQSRQLLDASRTGFAAGRTGIVQVLEAQRTYRSVQAEYIDALINHALAQAELERATGAFSADVLRTVIAAARSKK